MKKSHSHPIDPASALSLLREGNLRFVTETSRHPNQDAKTRAALASGQKPHSIILSCSDSRTTPEIIFDQGLGDLFVVRVAGNVADSCAVASIEYAVDHLGTKLILVLGHDACGAVTAALEKPASASSGSSDLDRLVATIQANIRQDNQIGLKEDSPKSVLEHAIKANVEATTKALASRSTVIPEAIARDNLLLTGGIYHLGTGKVKFYDF